MKQINEILPDNLVAKKLIGSEEGQDNLTLLLVPRFRKGPLAKWLQPRLKKPHIKVQLDEVGTFVWGKIDGQNTISDIENLMKGHFGQKVEPAGERLRLFLTHLHKNGFIQYFQRC